MTINRNFFLLWQGLTLSTLGNILYQMVGVLWLIKTANSASLAGAFLLVGGFFTAIFTPLGGVVADRFSRCNILVVADVSSGLVLLSLASVFFLSNSTSIRITGFFITQIILGINMGFFIPAIYTLLPDIVLKEKLSVGNAVTNTTINASLIIGRALSGLLFVSLSVPILIFSIGSNLLLSALSEWFIKLPSPEKNTSTQPTTKNMKRKVIISIVNDIQQGVSYILADQGMTMAFFIVMGLAWYLGALMVSLPFLVQYHLFEPSAWYGYLLASLSFGTILGSVYAGMKFNQLEGLGNRTHLLVTSLVTIPILCVGLAFVQNVYTALALCFLSGVFQGCATIIIMTQMQLISPNNFLGRVMSVFVIISALVLPLSSFVGGVLIDSLDKNIVLVQCIVGIAGGLFIYPVLIYKALWSFIISPSVN